MKPTRSSAWPIYSAAFVLGLISLVSVVLILLAMQDTSAASYLKLTIALALIISSSATGLTILTVVVTRRPWGIDPNTYTGIDRRSRDPFGLTTDELLAEPREVTLPDGKPYGKRKSDDTEVVERLIRHLEQQSTTQPQQDERPDWARDILDDLDPPVTP